MVLVANDGYAVAEAPVPILSVPDTRLRVPVAVTWYPPSLNRLFDVTSPMVKLPVLMAAPGVTPAALFTLSVAKVVAPPMVCAEEPEKETIPVPAVKVPLFVQFVFTSIV